MKIRQGFVSNSSSSSFLIAYKDTKDFDRFSSFKGFDIFKKDMEAAEEFDEEAVKAFLVSKLKTYFYSLYTTWDEFGEEKENLNELLDISDNVDARDFLCSLSAARGKFGAFENDFWKDLEESQPELYAFVAPLMLTSVDLDDYVIRMASEEHKKTWLEVVLKYRARCREYYYGDEFREIVNKAANELIDAYKKSHIKLKVLRYEDHSDEGSYMEHDFMTFLAGDPEEKFNVFILNQH